MGDGLNNQLQDFNKLAERRNQLLDTYGNFDGIKDWVNNPNWKPDYDPIQASAYGDMFADDPNFKSTLQSINSARARWNSLSDSERAIATDQQKQLGLEYDKRKKERDTLQQVSRIMDQKEAASKAAGSRSGGARPIVTATPEAAQNPGAKTLLGL